MFGRRVAPPVPVDDKRPLVLPDGQAVQVRWVRDARARRLRLIVNEKGVRLTLPKRASVALAESFLRDQGGWLQRQLANWLEDEVAEFAVGSERHLLLRGERVPLTWLEGRYAKVSLGNHGIEIALPVRATLKHARVAIRDFYLDQAKSDLNRWLPNYLPALPRGPTGYRIRPLSSIWGSLSAGDALSLDLALVLGAPSTFEYVLVHELCHLVQRNHSPRFWREVEARWPQWRLERDYLKREGARLKRELRRLLG